MGGGGRDRLVVRFAPTARHRAGYRFDEKAAFPSGCGGFLAPGRKEIHCSETAGDHALVLDPAHHVPHPSAVPVVVRQMWRTRKMRWLSRVPVVPRDLSYGDRHEWQGGLAPERDFGGQISAVGEGQFCDIQVWGSA